MNEPLTIVLPMHNAERQLRRTVREILELAANSTRELRMAIVDDGSTDDTFELACELSRAYPQVIVIRQPFQRGLGPAIDRVRRELNITQAIVHDGVSPVDLDELTECLGCGPSPGLAAPVAEPCGSRRFASVTALNAQMQKVHRRVASFRWLQIDSRTVARRQQAPRAVADLSQGVPAATATSPVES